MWLSLTILGTVLTHGIPAFDAPDVFICAVAEAVSCVQDEARTKGSAGKINLPLICKVGLKEKSIVSLRGSGEKRISKTQISNDTGDHDETIVPVIKNLYHWHGHDPGGVQPIYGRGSTDPALEQGSGAAPDFTGNGRALQ
jgi:hypothetical protein